MSKYLSSLLIIIFLCFTLHVLSLEKEKQNEQTSDEHKELLIPQNHKDNKKDKGRDQSLKRQNRDYYGFLEVPGTRIQYPVMFSPDTPDFYLDHDFEGKSSSHGLPYVSSDYEIGNKHLIIHGHNMPDGTMFSELLKFGNKDYFDNHSKTVLSRNGSLREFSIIAAVYTQLKSPGELEYYTFMPINNVREIESYLKQVKQHAHLRRELEMETKEIKEIMTLSTCSYHVDENGRFLLIAVY